MTRYTQSENFNIKGPGLPEQGVVSVGPGELEKAFEAGMKEGARPMDEMRAALNALGPMRLECDD